MRSALKHINQQKSEDLIWFIFIYTIWGFPSGSVIKKIHLECRSRRRQIQTLGGEDPLEEAMATHSRTLTWRIPMDREARRTTVYRVAKRGTWLEWLSTHTCTQYIHTIYIISYMIDIYNIIYAYVYKYYIFYSLLVEVYFKFQWLCLIWIRRFNHLYIFSVFYSSMQHITKLIISMLQFQLISWFRTNSLGFDNPTEVNLALGMFWKLCYCSGSKREWGR